MKLNRKLKGLLKLALLFLSLTTYHFTANAQEKTPDKIAERIFMPAVQMGFINHNSENISSGLLIQTSLEYRTKKDLLFRLNYDDFSGRINLKYTNNQTYSARIPISEFIVGIGYRLTKKRNNYFLIVQSGIRLYENPIIDNTNGNLNINQKGETIATIRYTLGYEYELFENVFLNSEIFLGHFYNSKDFWKNENPPFGMTLGISARLF
jgi:hypothetical protein